jgi:hypothetical protein
MPEVLVDQRTCGACGADVRPESLYCYNCGEEINDLQGAVKPIQRPDFEPDEKPILSPSITSKDSAPVAPKVAVERITQANGQPLESAASLRRRTRVMERKPVEVVWESAEGPNILLIVSTIVLFLFSLVVIGIALYYR